MTATVTAHGRAGYAEPGVLTALMGGSGAGKVRPPLPPVLSRSNAVRTTRLGAAASPPCACCCARASAACAT